MNIITLAHGAGGSSMHEIIEFLRSKFSNRILNEMSDAAELDISRTRLAFSTDSFVIKPLFFPGGDIGKLAVCGTVNDLLMRGAKPLYISLAFIVEEGLEFPTFEKIVDSIRKASRRAGVKIVTGDFKVVEKGAADKIFINTAGIGVIEHKIRKVGVKAERGDAIMINGGIAEHGMAVLNAREGLGFESGIKSDCCSLNLEVSKCLERAKYISVMRDPTRGGLATTLNEIANTSDLGIEIYEKDIPIKRNVKNICDILGFDPLYVANEGKFVCFTAKRDAERIKKATGSKMRIIGEVTGKHKKEVYLRTRVGSSRILPMLEADQLPRIC
ncbi:MAG: hydrogenase expression/formation protein HypE [Candidatus Omnitrophota bacterium]